MVYIVGSQSCLVRDSKMSEVRVVDLETIVEDIMLFISCIILVENKTQKLPIRGHQSLEKRTNIDHFLY